MQERVKQPIPPWLYRNDCIYKGCFILFSWLETGLYPDMSIRKITGVLIDKQTINVYYDYKRGENRSEMEE